ncbi:MAG TPA: PLD nuclease N-terminal domain-containing protein [Ktedonobacteraceae bacterium]|nr:PLD nuclease N-terminal domain-containing protein [Ktedonobacteraceae bacterium]
MDIIIHWLVALLPWLPLFQVAMFLDCLTNRSMEKSTKFGWILFIVLAQGFGAICYFFFAPSFSLRKISYILGLFAGFLQRKYQQFNQSQKRRQSQPKAGYEQPLGNYDQGYQAQTISYPPEEREPEYILPDEQPQTSYPQLPQQQQQDNLY